MSGYRFDGEWRIAADAGRVFAALVEVDAYPDWWPGVTRALRLDDTSGVITVRGLLPIDVAFTATQRCVDPERRVLIAGFSGDLEGVGRWDVAQVRGGTRARYREHVALGRQLRWRAGPLAGPVVKASHARLMRAGERGLADYLAAPVR